MGSGLVSHPHAQGPRWNPGGRAWGAVGGGWPPVASCRLPWALSGRLSRFRRFWGPVGLNGDPKSSSRLAEPVRGVGVFGFVLWPKGLKLPGVVSMDKCHLLGLVARVTPFSHVEY